jgi:hypothetical protein
VLGDFIIALVNRLQLCAGNLQDVNGIAHLLLSFWLLLPSGEGILFKISGKL